MEPLRGAPGPAVSSTHEGITVPGGISNQQFTLASRFPLEPTSSVIVLKLRGDVDGCSGCGANHRGAQTHLWDVRQE
jgi:hypothetical protein